MKIEKVKFNQWDQAYQCTLDDMQLIVVTQIGPRIMSLRRPNGENILYLDHTDFKFGDWRLYGGHRITTAPETNETYEPENEPCEITIAENLLTVTQPVRRTAVQRILEITADELSQSFEFRYHLRNTGPMLWYGAPWTVTCVNPAGQILLPWGMGSEKWRCNMVRYWSRIGNDQLPVNSEQWQPDNDVFLVQPKGQVGKIGLYSDQGWMALLRNDCTFIQKFQPITDQHQYPDQGCNLEVYTDPNFVEMEFLGPLQTLHPHQQLTMTQWWKLTDKTFTPDQWRQIIKC